MKYENMPRFTYIESDIDFSEFARIHGTNFELVNADCKNQVFYIKAKAFEKDLNELDETEDKVNTLTDYFVGLRIVMILPQSLELERISHLGRYFYKTIRDIILKHKARLLIAKHKIWECKECDTDFLAKDSVKVLKSYKKFKHYSKMYIRYMDGTHFVLLKITYKILGFNSGIEKLFEKILMQEIQNWRLAK